MAPARLLDLTRSLRRTGRLPTGVDRVERAYLKHLLCDDVPLFGLLRTAFGYVILDPKGCARFQGRLMGRLAWPKIDMLSRLPRRDDDIARAETAVRADALARCIPFGLPRMLKRYLPDGFDYFNVGHSNLTDRVLGGVQAASGASYVLIHDVIPLEYPEFQREETVSAFAQKMQKVSRFADRVIYNSGDTQTRAERYFDEWGRVPKSVVAHLGVELVHPNPAQNIPDRPYFMAIGTIEPRKNHAFLLDLWEQLGPEPPLLLICGRRGWNNADVFRRLDAVSPDGPVKEMQDLKDDALTALLSNSAGLLFPSHAEGFGLPPVESLAAGTRVLCNDLPVFREILGGFGNFVPVTDSKSWLETIKTWEVTPTTVSKTSGFETPTWANHFNTVLRLK